MLRITILEQLLIYLVHFGHRPLPIDYGLPVMFIDARSIMDIKECVGSALGYLEGYNKIGLVTTTQHLHALNEIADFLEQNGKEVLMSEGVGTTRGQVLGCNFSGIKDVDADAYLYVGTGKFHALGIKLFTDKPVVVADPYLGDASELDEFADRILRIRFARILKQWRQRSSGNHSFIQEGPVKNGACKIIKEYVGRIWKRSVFNLTR